MKNNSKEQLLRIENKVDNLSNQVSGLYAQINHQKDNLSNQLINKIKVWLRGEISDVRSNPHDVFDGNVDSRELGILDGRYECAEGLTEQIKKWEKELNE